ncbi:MFS transporter [Yaniella flava]|uniref:MFS transporter n=1 Tax=Yaniella flava TaxID=287930 RepID=UPI0031E08FFF
MAIASFSGTAIEWYDFFIFGTAAALVFNTAFFPDLDPVAGTLASFATFGVAFFARPVGAIVFGHFGDRIGRKTMLVLSLLIMGIATVSIGFIPTYDDIGIMAPILLVIARVLQGFAVGGEWGGAVLMAVEHAPPRKRAFYGSFPQAGVPAGLVLSTGAFLLVELMPEAEMMAWGWRIPFWASGLLVIVGLYIRMKIVESPEFQQVKDEDRVTKFPIVEVFKTQTPAFFVGLFTQAVSLVPFYLVTVFMLSYGPDEMGISRQVLLLTLLLACVLDLFTVPLASIWADRIGPRKMLIFGSIYMAIIAYPVLLLFATANTVLVMLGMILVITIGHAVTYSAVAGYVSALFPAAVRYTGAAFAYQMGGMVFSSTAPFLATAIAAATQGEWALALYIILACAITVIALTVPKAAKVRHH